MLPSNNTVKKEINGKLIEIIPYSALPCEVQEFYINKKLIENFDKEDFGESFESETYGSDMILENLVTVVLIEYLKDTIRIMRIIQKKLLKRQKKNMGSRISNMMKFVYY